MDTKELEAMNEDQVKQVANDLGVEFHPKNGKKQIIAKIVAALDGAAPESDGEEAEASEGDDSDENELDKILDAEEKTEVVEPKLTSRQIKENENFEKKHPELAKKLVQRKEDDRDDRNVLKPHHAAVQAHQPHDSVSKEIATVETAKKALAPLVARGLEIVKMDKTYWHLRAGKKEASGNMHMPLSTLFFEANLLLRNTHIARDDGANPQAVTVK